MIDRGRDFGEENIVGPNDNVVRMMTIHSSKGLEFPFVIYSGLSKKYNEKDLTQPVILNQQYGLGMDYYDTDKEMVYPSLSSAAYRAINRKEHISEEMRLIYVALTRAKEQLILIGRVKKEQELTELEQLPISADLIAVNERLTAKNSFKFIYSILSKHQSASLPDDQKFERDIETLNSEVKPRVTITIDHYEDVSTEEVTPENERRTVNDIDDINSGNDDVKAKIHHQLAYRYPYQDDTLKPSKQSVSELKRQLETEESDTNYDRVRQYRIGVATYERPRFLSENKKRKANEIGTLMHTVMQHLPFNESGLTREELDSYVDKLIQLNIIEEDAKADIKYDDIMRFIESSLYLQIAQADKVYTELPFVVNQAMVDQLPEDNQDVSIIQGMIDLIFQKDGKYYFVDYKTDAFNRRKGITDDEIGQQLKQKYQIQMEYYRNTLETILKQPVQGYLYFFKFGMLKIDE